MILPTASCPSTRGKDTLGSFARHMCISEPQIPAARISTTMTSRDISIETSRSCKGALNSSITIALAFRVDILISPAFTFFSFQLFSSIPSNCQPALRHLPRQQRCPGCLSAPNIHVCRLAKKLDGDDIFRLPAVFLQSESFGQTPD